MNDFPGRYAVIAMALVAAGSAQAAVSGQSDSDVTPSVDAAAISALEGMSSHLRSLKRFAVAADISRDQVIAGNGKLQFDHELALRFVRGEGLFVNASYPERDLQYFYNGKQFTLYSPRTQYYATVDAPPTVAATMDAIEEKYGVDLPLADIFSWGTEGQSTDAIEGAIVVGPGRVNGQDCRHYAYRQANVDWQLCITEGERPLPLKLLITTTDLVQQPAFVARMQWDLAPEVDASGFTFVPPEGAAKISFRPLTDQQ